MNESDGMAAESRLQPRRSWIRGALAVAAVLSVAYFALAYVLMPLLWKGYAHRHPALDDTPGITMTSDKHPGDPINVALVGTEAEVKAIMLAAHWVAADPLGLRSDVKIAAATVLKRPYETAPVSNLYLFGRKEDLAFEQPVGSNPRQRHHVRFWKSAQVDERGRPLWAGSATFDQRVGLSHTTGQITHHIAADVDAERDHLVGNLQQAGEWIEVYFIDDFHKLLTGRNGGGDLWKTDGRLAVVIISRDSFGP